LQVVDHRTHDFDDGSIATVYSRIAPVKLHENETNEISNHLNHVSKRLKIFGEGTKEIGEHNKLVGSSQVKGKIVEVSDDNNMDIDQPKVSTSKNSENSPSSLTGTDFELLSDRELEKASKDQLIYLGKRIRKELEIREKIEADLNNSSQTPSYQVSTQELKDKLQKSEQFLNDFQNPASNIDNKKSDNSGKTGIIVGIVGVSALAIGGIALVKSKLGKSKKK